jgi:hypothetical protein
MPRSTDHELINHLDPFLPGDQVTRVKIDLATWHHVATSNSFNLIILWVTRYHAFGSRDLPPPAAVGHMHDIGHAIEA